MSDVVMPRLSDSMEEGTILKWLKSSGDSVARGEELVEIETDKANMTYESDQEGVLEIIAAEGDTLPVGVPIAKIGDGVSTPAASEKQAPVASDKETPAASEEAPAASADAPSEPTTTSAPAADQPAANAENGRIKASPLARRMANERGLSLSEIEGSGPGGRIVKADIEALSGAATPAAAPKPATPAPAAPAAPAAAPAAPAPPAAPPTTISEGATIKGDVTVQELTRLQQVIARRMAESKATAPEFVLNIEVEMDEAVSLRKRLKAAAEGTDRPTPSFNDFIVKATALALRDFPRANGAYKDGKFELYSRINVGIAVAAQDALVVPTIFDADRKSIGEISQDSRALAERVRAGVVTPPELSGGTFSVSNLGMFGITNFTAVINPPQAAILAVGAMTERPVVRDGEVTTRQILELTLTCDHRILYGADASQFLNRIKERLQQPLLFAL